MQSVATDRATSEFRVLAQRVRDAGLLERRRGYYGWKIALTVAAYAAGWVGVVLVGPSWACLGLAAFLGIMFTQLGFLAHDAGHRQVFRSRRANDLLGLAVGNVLVGMSFGWWVPKHDAHHAHPNEIGVDPDLGGGFVPSNAGVDRPSGASAVASPEGRRQALLFFPLMLMRSTGLHVSGIQSLLRRRDRRAALEGALIAAHAAAYLVLVLWILAPLQALAFVIVQQAVFSLYVGGSFAPNHKGMPVVDPTAKLGFPQRQVITARNIKGGAFTDLLLGGLNHQIEHHLFPTMPRPNLKRARGLVRAFCIDTGFGFCEDSLLGSYRRTVCHLQEGAPIVVAAIRLPDLPTAVVPRH